MLVNHKRKVVEDLVDEHLNLSLGPDSSNNHDRFLVRPGHSLRRFRSFLPDPTYPAAPASLAGRLRLGRLPRPAAEAISRPTRRPTPTGEDPKP